MKLFGYELRRSAGDIEAKSSTREMLQEMFAGQGTKSGAKVSHKTALEVTTALACARVIAEGLAQIPFRVYRDLPKGGKEIARDHPLSPLLTRRPNDWMTSFELREMIGMHCVIGGNFIAYKVRGPRGQILELLPYLPGDVVVKRKDWVLTYELPGPNGTRITVSADDIWHVRGPSWDGWNGIDTVKVMREALGLALATEEHSARVFSNGARLGGVLSSDVSKMDPEQAKLLRKSWEETYGGNKNAFKTAVLWGGMKWAPAAQENDKAQLIEQRRFQIEEICRGARVLPLMVGYSDKTQTFASAEQMFLAHLVHTMGPWYRRIEESANVNLLTDDDAKNGYYTKFVVQGLMRGAAKDRVEYYKGMYSVGALNPNQIRELEDWNPYEGGEQYRVPLNMEDPNATPADSGNAKAGADNATP